MTTKRASSKSDSPLPASDQIADLSTAEVAARLGVTERTVRRAIARGDLPAEKRSGTYRVREQDVAAYATRAQHDKLDGTTAAARYLPEQLLAEHTAANSSYVPRTALQEDLTGLLLDPAAHIVTLTGPGGAGKSRLAMEAASDVATRFPHGVSFIPLAGILDPALVVPAIASALGIQEVVGHDLTPLIAATLSGTRRLIVLDNFEQILAAAPLVAWMATVAPDCKFLVTSRAPLRVRGEQELPVPSMHIAAEDATLEEVLSSEAGQLFVTRAREHLPSFTVDAANAPLITEICARLDGLPLAIELAAARVKLLDLAQLLKQLHRRLPLLSAGPADAPHRHSTMRDAIAWSYGLLSTDEQRVFRHLAVCVGGCTLDACLTLANAEDEAPAPQLPRWDTEGASEHDVAVLEHMATLVDHSLMTVAPGLDGSLRYGMLETIREFGVIHLTGTEHSAVRAAHARFFLDLAWQARPLVTTRATYTPMGALAADVENIRAALTWLDQAGPDADFARLVASTYIFMFAGGHFEEGTAWLRRAHAKIGGLPPLERALLQVGMAELLMVSGAHDDAIAAFADILPLVRKAGSPFDLANALISSGVAQVYAGEHAAGEAHLQEARALADQIPDRQLQAAVAARALANLSVAARAQGNLEAAASRGEAALRRCRATRLELAEARILVDLGDIAREQARPAHAIVQYQACLRHYDERGEVRLVADSLDGIASALTMRGDDVTALPLFDTAARLRERTGYHLLLPADLARHERDIYAASQRLGEATADATLRAWRDRPLADVIALALAVKPGEDEHLRSEPPDELVIELTPREAEILGLLVESCTDREIADMLYLSPRTVSWHVRHILEKLGATSRRDAISRARQAGLPAQATDRRPARG